MSTFLSFLKELWFASPAKPEFERMDPEDVLKLDDKSFDNVIESQPEVTKNLLRAIRPTYLQMKPEDHEATRKEREVLVSTAKQCGYTLVPTFDRLVGDLKLHVKGEDRVKLLDATSAISGKPIIYTLRSRP